MTTRLNANRLIPGRGPVIDDAVVIMDGATVSYAGHRAAAPESPGAEVVHADTVMPGMWDCHTHLIGLQRMALTGLYEVPIAVRAARATKDLERALQAGVTSIRDAGGMGVLLGRAVREGSIPGPHVYGAGAILSTTGGHGDLHDLAAHEGTLRVCDGVVACITAVREQLRIGADVIKVCAAMVERDVLLVPTRLIVSDLMAAPIEAATANGPRSLGARAPHTGQLAAGFDADVLTVQGDPSTDIAVLADPHNITGVWKHGTGITDRS